MILKLRKITNEPIINSFPCLLCEFGLDAFTSFPLRETKPQLVIWLLENCVIVGSDVGLTAVAPSATKPSVGGLCSLMNFIPRFRAAIISSMALCANGNLGCGYMVRRANKK